MHLANALSRERSRHPAIRIAAVLAFILGLGAAHGWVGLTIGGAAPALSPPTVGVYSALVATSLLTLVGFFLVRGNIERDRRTRVGELFAASSLSAPSYMLAQFVANATLLCGLLACVVVGAFAVPGKSWAVELRTVSDVLLPVFLLAVPSLVFVAGIAVILDASPVTSCAAGNVIFFIAWLALLSSSFGASGGDFMGSGTVIASLKERTHLLIPPVSNDVALFIDFPKPHRAYEWTGMSWTTAKILQRMLWLGAGLVVALAAVPIVELLGGRATIFSTPVTASAPLPESIESSFARWSAGPADTETSSLRAIIASELGVLQHDLRWWHVLACAVSVFAGISSESGQAMHRILPLAWLWPAGLLATIGSREFVSGVDQILVTNSRATANRVIAASLAGVILMAACGSGVLVRILLGGHSGLILGWLGGALFVPALSLLLGELSRSQRPFEAVYLLIWYLGPIHGNRALDFAGSTIERGNATQGALFVIVAFMMVGLVVWRRRQRNLV